MEDANFLDDTTDQSYELQTYICDLFEPCEQIEESDELFTTREVFDRMRGEGLDEINPPMVKNALKKAGFIMLPIEGIGYWMVRFRA